jgi:C4-dicarboxylate-specific signal transduction histidine kinase
MPLKQSRGFGQILLKTWADETAVFISVQDSGRAMAPPVMARIFDPCYTTKPVGQGTGLGLSISFKIIQDHGGLIRVASGRPESGWLRSSWF